MLSPINKFYESNTVDDEPDGIRTLKKLLELNCPEVEIAATCSNVASAKQKLEKLNPTWYFWM
jgi:two-component system LytT family response regulator